MRVYLLIWGFMAAGIMAGCGGEIEPGTTPPGKPVAVSVRTAIAEPVLEQRRHEAVGTLKPRVYSTLSSRVMGSVAAVNVDDGQRVQEGQTLVVLTRQQIAADYQRALAALEEARRGQATAKASVNMATANAELATATYKRYQQLVSGESASPQEFDEVRAKYEAARAAVDQAKSMLSAADDREKGARAALDAAAATTRDMVVTAPYDGVITEKLVEPGDLASPGQPLLRMEGFEGFRVVFALEEAMIQAATMGLALEVAIPALGDRRIQGTIEAISPVADAATRSVEVKLAMPSLPDLRSGQFARVFVPGEKTKIMRLPKRAIVKKGQLTGVYQVNSDGILRFRLVRTGRFLDENVEILSGMKAGDRYVLAPGPETVDGRMAEEVP